VFTSIVLISNIFETIYIKFPISKQFELKPSLVGSQIKLSLQAFSNKKLGKTGKTKRRESLVQ